MASRDHDATAGPDPTSDTDSGVGRPAGPGSEPGTGPDELKAGSESETTEDTSAQASTSRTRAEDVMRVHVTAENIDVLRTALVDHRAALAGRIHTHEQGRVGIDAYLPLSEVRALRSAQPVEVAVVGNATEHDQERHREVGPPDGYDDGAIPQGFGDLIGGSRG